MPGRYGGASCRVFLGNLSHRVQEKDIKRFLDRYGSVRHVFLKQGRYAFCEFDDYRDADDAVYDLNGKELLGERVTVEHARGPRRPRDRFSGGRAGWVDKYGAPHRTKYRVIVENLSSRVSWQDVKDLMRRVASVTYATAHTYRKNEGVVDFSSRRDMERAIEKYDNYELNGRKIIMIPEERRSSRSRSASRNRSRSRSRNRSRSKSMERSRSRSKDRSRSRSKNRSRSKSKDRSRSKSKDKSRSRSKDRSRSRSKSKSRSPLPENSRSSRRRSRSRSDGSDGPEKSRAKASEERLSTRDQRHKLDGKGDHRGSMSNDDSDKE